MNYVMHNNKNAETHPRYFVVLVHTIVVLRRGISSSPAKHRPN